MSKWLAEVQDPETDKWSAIGFRPTEGAARAACDAHFELRRRRVSIQFRVAEWVEVPETLAEFRLTRPL